MLQDGLLERFPCDAFYGMHNWPTVPQGSFSVRAGPIMASVDNFTVKICGVGGHAALPHMCVDPIVAASQMVVALQTLVSRVANPLDAAVVSVTEISGGSASNIIPDSAVFSGTIRAFCQETREAMETHMRRVVAGVADGLGVTAEVDVEYGYPATVNDAAKADFAAAVAQELVGTAAVIRDFEPTMGAEDMAYLLNERPGCYAWLGTGATGEEPMLHHPRYDFNDQCAPLGASWLARVVETSMPMAVA